MTHHDAPAASVRDRMAATGEDYPTALQAIQAERGARQPAAEQTVAAGTEAWRSVPWNAPLSAYHTTQDADHG